MDYPIYLSGELAGTLSERRDGLYSVFVARCPMRPGMHRLWVFGKGGRYYLGVLSPKGGELTLCRRLSNRARAALPSDLRYAADRPMGQPGIASQAADRTSSSPARQSPREAEQPQAGTVTWSERSDGILTARDGDTELLALPVRPCPAMHEKIRVINGREYLVFRRQREYTAK